MNSHDKFLLNANIWGLIFEERKKGQVSSVGGFVIFMFQRPISLQHIFYVGEREKESEKNFIIEIYWLQLITEGKF